MPDGDRLYWKVRGKGSRRVLNLLQSGLDDKLVADSAIRMFVEQVNHGGWKPVLREIAGVLVEALSESPSNGTSVERTDRFFQLTHQVEAVVSNHGDRALAPMIRAAQHVFRSLEDSAGHVGAGEIRERFLPEAAVKLLDHCVLQPTRQEVSRRLGLSRDEQFYFESRIFDEVKRGIAGLYDSLFTSPREAIRAPHRLQQKRSTDLARLHEPLPVVGGDL